MTRKFLLKQEYLPKEGLCDTIHITPLTPNTVDIDASECQGRQKAQDGHILKDTSWGREKRSGEKVGEPQDGQGTGTKPKPLTRTSCLKIWRQ